MNIKSMFVYLFFNKEDNFHTKLCQKSEMLTRKLQSTRNLLLKQQNYHKYTAQFSDQVFFSF